MNGRLRLSLLALLGSSTLVSAEVYSAIFQFDEALTVKGIDLSKAPKKDLGVAGDVIKGSVKLLDSDKNGHHDHSFAISGDGLPGEVSCHVFGNQPPRHDAFYTFLNKKNYLSIFGPLDGCENPQDCLTVTCKPESLRAWADCVAKEDGNLSSDKCNVKDFD